MHTSVKEASPAGAAQRAQMATNPSGIWTWLVAAALAIFYLATSIYIANHRVFWFDELFTVNIARLPSLGTIWNALGNGVDALPPTYYMLVRLSDSLFGPADFAARLPSALAMTIGLLVTFDCARRLMDGLHGLIAFSVATCSFLLYYGYEARSYAIYFMLAAVALWLWTYSGPRRKAATIGFGFAFLAGVCAHYYFVMCLAPYVLWELLRWKRGSRPSSKLISGIVGSIIPVLVLSPLILSFSRKFSGGYWNRPSFTELRLIFSQLFPDGLFLLALIAIWIVLVATDDEKSSVVQAMHPAEGIGWLFLGIPLAAFLVAEWKTNAFFSRYFIGVIPGVAVAFTFSLWRHYRKVAQVALGVFLLLGSWGVGQQLTVIRHPEKVEATGIRPFLQAESSLQIEGKRYFVFTAPLLFIEALYYSAHPERCVLLLPEDYNRQAKPGPDPYQHQRLEMNLSPYHPMQFWTVDDLRLHAADSALVDPTSDALKDIQRAGIATRTRFSTPLQVLYLQ